MRDTAHALMLAGIDSRDLHRTARTSGLFPRQLGQIDYGDETITGYPPVDDESDDYDPNQEYGTRWPDETTAQPPPGFVAPGAVPVVVGAWDVKATPARYQLQYGDTLVGLAATYLGDGGRWKEIWHSQSPNFRNTRSPDKLYASEKLNMPDEARDNFLSWVKQGKPPGTTPGQIANQEKEDEITRIASGIPTWVKYGAGVAVVGGAIWWLTS